MKSGGNRACRNNGLRVLDVPGIDIRGIEVTKGHREAVDGMGLVN